MTKEDIEALLPIIAEIDGGCSSCIQSFCESFNRVDSFPYYLNVTYYPVVVSSFDKADYEILWDEYEEDFKLSRRV